MADILIRGMEMPMNCAECPVNMYICKRGYKYLLERMKLYDQRAEDCPLIALSEGHGPLIDADKLMKHYAWWGECEQKELFDSIVEQQDTIVPAEKEVPTC